jgi:hypothetical protein
MKHTASNSFAERAGRALGRAWRGFLRRERSACGWLVSQGLPPGIAKALLLILRFAVLGAVLYAAFWVTVVGIAIAVVMWNGRNADSYWIRQKKEPEWREGLAGYGLYTYDEFRIDPHDPQDEE